MEIRLALDATEFRARRDGLGRVLLVDASGKTRNVRVDRQGDGTYVVTVPSDTAVPNDPSTSSARFPADAVRDGSRVWVRVQGRTYVFEIARGAKRARAAASGDLASPMPGQVQRLLVTAGDTVIAQQPLLVVEAMKMQIEIKSPRAGRVLRYLTAEGARVEAGVPLVELEAAS